MKIDNKFNRFDCEDNTVYTALNYLRKFKLMAKLIIGASVLCGAIFSVYIYSDNILGNIFYMLLTTALGASAVYFAIRNFLLESETYNIITILTIEKAIRVIIKSNDINEVIDAYETMKYCVDLAFKDDEYFINLLGFEIQSKGYCNFISCPILIKLKNKRDEIMATKNNLSKNIEDKFNLK